MGTLYRQRREGTAVLHRNGGVLPRLSDKTNGLPTDDMSMRGGHPDKILPREPSLGPAGEGTATTEKSSGQQRRESGHRARNAAPPMRRSWGFRAYRGVNAQSLVAAVASFRFQAGELAFLFSFLTFLPLGRGSSFSCHAFAFCLNRCL